MEHSYSRDCRPVNNDDGNNSLKTRSIMVHRPPQCPSCHTHTHDEGVDLEDFYSPPIPSYNETLAKECMHKSEILTLNSKNNHSDNSDWDVLLSKQTWTTQQIQIFEKISKILNSDRLARLAHKDRQHESVLRRVTIDKSVQRFRQALGSVSWDPKLTQWLHGVLMDNLPPYFLAAYLDILQTLKAKIPNLVDKMIFARTGGNQDLLKTVFKGPWEPVIDSKNRKLPNQPVIVIVPSGPSNNGISMRVQKLYSLFASMAAVIQVQCHISGSTLNKQGFQFVTDQLMSVTRAKIQEIKSETPNRSIILVGLNSGAALALQISLVEMVNCIVCMGFGYNTVHGVRGAPDDNLLDIVTPIMFIIGQNSARVSQEEIESLREKMHAHTTLVVVGSADDALRVGKNKRQIEGVTQAMVDNMVMDEIQEFATNCLINPPGPRQPTVQVIPANSISVSNGNVISTKNQTGNSTITPKKRKLLADGTEQPTAKMKSTGNSGSKGRGRPPLSSKTQERPQLMPLVNPTNEDLDMAIQSILPVTEMKMGSAKISQISPSKMMTAFEIVPAVSSKSKIDFKHLNQPPHSTIVTSAPVNQVMVPMIHRASQKVKVIPPNQFVQLKPPSTPQNIQKFLTIKPTISKSTIIPASVSPIVQSGQQIYTNKFYTIKSAGSQYVTSSQPSFVQQPPSSSSIMISPKKFTVIKPDGNQLSIAGKSQPDLSNTNIFDMPIVFADQDGNIQEAANISSTITSLPTSNAPIIINQQSPPTHHHQKDDTIKIMTQPSQNANRNILIHNLLVNKNKPNKVVLINRNAVKGVPNIITKNLQQLKYAKVVVTNSKESTSTTTMAMMTAPTIMKQMDNSGGAGDQMILSTVPSSGSGTKVEVINNTVIKPISSPMLSSTTAVSSPTTYTTGNVVGAATTQKFKPIIINMDAGGDKSNLKNVIKVGGAIGIGGDSQMKSTNTILIKSGSGLKQFPVIKQDLFNRNLTVKKVVNILPQKPINVRTIAGTSTAYITTTATPTSTAATFKLISSEAYKPNPPVTQDMDQN